jgi:hypothetical protein
MASSRQENSLEWAKICAKDPAIAHFLPEARKSQPEYLHIKFIAPDNDDDNMCVAGEKLPNNCANSHHRNVNTTAQSVGLEHSKAPQGEMLQGMDIMSMAPNANAKVKSTIIKQPSFNNTCNLLVCMHEYYYTHHKTLWCHGTHPFVFYQVQDESYLYILFHLNIL